MYQYWVISYNKCTTPMHDINNNGMVVVYENFRLSAQFFCKPKADLKIKFVIKIKEKTKCLKHTGCQ